MTTSAAEIDGGNHPFDNIVDIGIITAGSTIAKDWNGCSSIIKRLNLWMARSGLLAGAIDGKEPQADYG
jgi:hypothetical protein